MIDLRPDDEARLRRVLRHLDDEAPIPPELGELRSHAAGTSRRRFPPVLVGVTAFVLTLVTLVPAVLLSNDNLGDVDTAIDDGTTASSPSTVVSSVPLESTPPEAASLPELSDYEEANPPPVGEAEFQTLAASPNALFAAATVPNPELWDVRVWRSADGGDIWDEALRLVDEGVETDLVASDNELLLLMSDHVGDGGASLYRSTNEGRDWTRLELAMPDGSAGVFANTVATGPVTVIFGSAWDDVVETSLSEGSTESEYVNWRGVIWVLDDGQISGPFDGSGVGIVMSAQLHDGQYYAVGAEALGGQLHAIWTSGDGIGWSRVELPQLPSGWVPRGELDIVSSNGETLIAVGEIHTDAPEEAQSTGTAVYGTTDGQNWQLQVIDDHVIGHATSVPGGFIASASSENSLEFASSTDGLSWDYQPADMRFFGSAGSSNTSYLLGISNEGRVTLLRMAQD